MTFLWQYIDLDLELVESIKNKYLKVLPNNNILVQNIDTDIDNILGYPVSNTVLIQAEPNYSSPIHTDYYSDEYFPARGRLALNIPLANCENSLVEFFYSFESSIKSITSYNRPVEFYDIKKCVKLSEYVLNKPVILNTRVPHRFINFGMDRRLVISIRFKVDPWDWLSYNQN